VPQAHTSRDFESELRELRAHSLAMGARCERALQLALKAFWEGSAQLAAEVEELDRHIDRDEMDIDALILRIFALRQPVAYDLRFLAAALRLVTDLERVGDEAVNIAERAKEEHGTAKDDVRADLKTMGEQAQGCCARRSTRSCRASRRAPSRSSCATTPWTTSTAASSAR
jgi:phosphate transport system protein